MSQKPNKRQFVGVFGTELVNRRFDSVPSRLLTINELPMLRGALSQSLKSILATSRASRWLRWARTSVRCELPQLAPHSPPIPPGHPRTLQPSASSAGPAKELRSSPGSCEGTSWQGATGGAGVAISGRPAFSVRVSPASVCWKKIKRFCERVKKMA